jgi:tRNA (guanine-N7-)-methyltransferase
MVQSTLVAAPDGDRPLADLPAPLPLDELVPGGGPWEVELGFGKGRYLLHRAQEDPARRFLGVEMASKYFRLAVDRARKRGLRNLLAIRGEAVYLAAAVLPAGFATALHVYFPDPWPKSRHHKRRLFDAESIDLVLGLLEPGGRLFFATDFLDYGAEVEAVLAGHPRLELRRHDGPWPEGPRTNYEAKYEREGRPILRLEATLRPAPSPAAGAPAVGLHPAAETAVTVARWVGEDQRTRQV